VLISRMTNDVEALDSLVTDTVITLFQASLTLVGSIVILLLLDVKLALITFLIFPVMAAASLAFRIASADAYRRTRETIGAITAYLQETLSASGSCARSARSRATARASPSSTGSTARRT
jgi:ATP-binding cassette subfamily B protein